MNAAQRPIWPARRFPKTLIRRWRLIAGVAVITVALVSLCAYAALPIYSATCTIRNNDDGTLMMEFIKRHPNAHPSAY